MGCGHHSPPTRPNWNLPPHPDTAVDATASLGTIAAAFAYAAASAATSTASASASEILHVCIESTAQAKGQLCVAPGGSACRQVVPPYTPRAPAGVGSCADLLLACGRCWGAASHPLHARSSSSFWGRV